ncbi:MAG: GGDEF domain-containing protein [Desulfobacteraceae bacterium]|nr:GGDEF domain-containing protein [Desulfobacteraceae bacterium]
MNQTFKILSRRFLAAFSVIFREAARQADHAVLSRHIVALNKKTSSTDIINELSVCLKNTLNYRLFAFVVKKEAGVDVWLDPGMYKQSLEHIILQDFNLENPADLTYLNHDFPPDDHRENKNQYIHSLDHLNFYEIFEDNCYARLYMVPRKPVYAFHDEVVQLMLQGCAAALSRQLKIENLKTAAVIDPLTGCYNRREMETQLCRHIASATRYKNNLSLFMFDLDHFKDINDTHGHQAGDLILKEISFLVKDNMRQGDILARYGGEEFIAILPETGKHKAMELADRLRAKIAALKIPYNGTNLQVTASFGVSQLASGMDMHRLIQDADTMLYKAKRNGRNTVMPGLIKICSRLAVTI